MSPLEVAVSMKYLQKTGFFAICVGLCGLLLGLTGCASVKNVMKKTVAVFESAAVFGGGLEKSAPKNRQEDAKKRDGETANELAIIFSRQEEAQRLGRILRPKKSGEEAHFYTVITGETKEQEFAMKRQLFLTEQGYRYHIEEYSDSEGNKATAPA